MLAGPGSGKTAVITNRVMELITEHGADPSKILVITFSRAAAVEMKERYIRLSGDRYTSVSFGTFHAIFFKIIKSAYHYDNSSIITDDDRNRILRDFVRDNSIISDNISELVSELASNISVVKSEEINPKDYPVSVCTAEQFVNIYNSYNRYLRSENKLDFDDMMGLCYRLFLKDAKALRHWQSQFEYILIDEFQDINSMQYNIVKMLAMPENNIFAVGDDDQSIYGFRGAHPELMFKFEKDYPDCRRILLNYNYRSDTAIVDASLRLIANNRNRFKKNVLASSTNAGSVEFIEFDTFEEENSFVADYAATASEKVAVLYRANSEVQNLYMLLTARNIPCRIKDRGSLVYDHWIAKDLFAYLRLSCGMGELADWLRVANRPNRYITRESILSSDADIGRLKQLNKNRGYITASIERLESNLNFMAKLDLYARIKFIRKAVGYDAFLLEYSKEKKVPVAELYKVLELLEESAYAYKDFGEWNDAVCECRKAAAKERNGREDAKNAVELMTFHASKGLEFDTVFIIDALEGFTPQKLKVEADAELMSEERRAFYVAMTRAKHKLYILSSKDRIGRQFAISRFVGECMGIKNPGACAPGPVHT